MRDSSATIIDYYDGAYGPTLRIDVQSYDWLVLLHNYTTQLMEGEIENIDFLNLDKVEAIDISSFKLYKSRKKYVYCPVRKTYDADKKLVFTWLYSADQLYHILGLIERLIEVDRPGHQYLTDGSGKEIKEIIVELAYKE